MKGIIALDIDGTLTVGHHPIPPEVINYLTQLSQDGWELIFITGRTFQWGYSVLKDLPFSYHYAAYNGAIIAAMPAQKIISKKYLSKDIIPVMEEICEDEPTDFVIYSGLEGKEKCFFRPKFFSEQLLSYLKIRIQTVKEEWIEMSSFSHLPIHEFPSIKCFGDKQSIDRIKAKIESLLGLHVPPIQDPYNPDYIIAQASHPEINKGYTLRDFKKVLGWSGITIAAGDDVNDETLLSEADISVVMATAPKSTLKLANIIAPSAKENGIIQGLQQAVKEAIK